MIKFFKRIVFLIKNFVIFKTTLRKSKCETCGKAVLYAIVWFRKRPKGDCIQCESKRTGGACFPTWSSY